jgi:hypothetical protein
MKKTWQLINELNSRNCTKIKRISEIKIGEQVVTSPVEMVETFNSYFSNVGDDLAAEIPASEYNTEVYLTDLQIKRSTCKLLRLIESTEC